MRSLLCLIFILSTPHVGWSLQGDRIESADLEKLRGLASGRVEAESASFDMALGRIGAFGFGKVGCDERGFAHRPLIHSKAVLRVEIPHGTRRLDLIIRPTLGTRELSVVADGALWGRVTLEQGWQRIRLPIREEQTGSQVLELSLTKPSTRFQEASDFGTKVLGLFHAIIPKSTTQKERSVSPQLTSVSQPGVFWLEAGEIMKIPVLPQKGQALTADGLVLEGPGPLTVKVTLVSAQGARAEVAEMSTRLRLPWNLDISRGGERTPYWLRLDVVGDEGRVALKRPRLTVFGQTPTASRVSVGDRPVVVIAVRNLGMADALAARVDLGGTLLRATHTTSTHEVAALRSLFSGKYPSRSAKKKAPSARTFAGMARDAGRYTALVSGVFPRLDDTFPASDFSHRRGSAPDTFGAHAGAVLKEAEGLLMDVRRKKPLITVVLGDPAFPFFPRSERWKSHTSHTGKPPWKPARTRAVLLKLQKAGAALSPRQAEYVTALRRGAVEDTLRAIREFSVRVNNRGLKPLIVIVGLGAQAWPPSSGAMDAANTLVPVWFLGEAMPHAAIVQRADLTDVATTLAGMLRSVKSRMQGSDLRSSLPGTWSDPAFVRDAFGGSLVVAHDGGSAWTPAGHVGAGWVKGKGGWAPASKSLSDGFVAEVLSRLVRAWEGAGSAWRPVLHGASMRRGEELAPSPVCVGESSR